MFINIIDYCTIIYFILLFRDRSENYETSMKTRTLDKDGFCVLYNKEYPEKRDQLKNDVLKLLPDDYMFIDYEYNIVNGSLYTFHRDVTSSQNIYNTKHPVYTLILYQYDGDLLSMCPNSHASYPFVNSRIVNISGKNGTAILFDCDILHAGMMSHPNRKLTQYKICHKEDTDKLQHLKQRIKVKNATNEPTTGKYITRKASYYFEFPINYIFYPLFIKREGDGSLIGQIQSLFPLDYYYNV